MIENDITKWKTKWGKVLKVRLEGADVYYRPLTAGELIKIQTLDPYSNVPAWVILNDVKLKLTGSLIKITEYALQASEIITDVDDLRIKAIQNREAVEKSIQVNFINGIIVNLPSIYPCYTPDELRNMTLPQLLKVVAMAEVATGRELIKTSATIPTAMPETRETNKFAKPNEAEAMETATIALKNEMAKYGKKAPTLAEVKKPSNLSDLHRQMKELSGI